MAIKEFNLSIKDIEDEIKETGYWECQLGVALIWVQKRPDYCDRGRWQLNAKSFDSRMVSIDEQDGFPRYYFTNEALILEVMAWLRARKLIL